MINCKRYLLKKIASIRSGYSIRRRIKENPASGMKIIQMKDIDPENGIIWKNLMGINPISKRIPSFVKKDDIIFSGRGTRIFAVPVNIPVVSTVAAPQLFIITPDTEKVNPVFLSWYINRNKAQKYFYKNASPTIIKNINRQVLENLPVILPSIEKQEMIVNYIKAINREKELLLQLYDRRNLLIEKSIMQSVVEGK